RVTRPVPPRARRSSPGPVEIVDGLPHRLLVDRVDLESRADVGKKRDGELAPEVLAELLDPGKNGTTPLAAHEAEGVVPKGKVQGLERAEHRVAHRLAREPHLGCVDGVDRHSDGHAFAVAQSVMRQALELVRGPVAEVERTRTAELERIARA